MNDRADPDDDHLRPRRNHPTQRPTPLVLFNGIAPTSRLNGAWVAEHMARIQHEEFPRRMRTPASPLVGDILEIQDRQTRPKPPWRWANAIKKKVGWGSPDQNVGSGQHDRTRPGSTSELGEVPALHATDDPPGSRSTSELSEKPRLSGVKSRLAGPAATHLVGLRGDGRLCTIDDLRMLGRQRVYAPQLESLNHAGFIDLSASKLLALRSREKEREKRRI